MNILFASCLMPTNCIVQNDLQFIPSVFDNVVFSGKTIHHLILLQTGTIREKSDSAVWLGENKVAIAVPFLCESLTCSDYNVRACAACALAEIGAKCAIIPLKKALLREEELFARDPFARTTPHAWEAMMWALGELADEH